MVQKGPKQEPLPPVNLLLERITVETPTKSQFSHILLLFVHVFLIPLAFPDDDGWYSGGY
jgi:hypothetical protein